jgi:L-asparaginase/Glu-tRNA(Gln) amidotransferase subunit D
MENAWGKLHAFLAPTESPASLKIAASREVNRLSRAERDELAQAVEADSTALELTYWRQLVDEVKHQPDGRLWDLAKDAMS